MKDRDRLGNVLSFLSLILVGALIYYLATAIRKVESLEDKLTYREPPLQQLSSEPSTELERRHATYVPVYSHIYTGKGRPVNLQTTLSIRNTEPGVPLNLHAVTYYNSEGVLVREYLESSASLGPMATAAYLVDLSDASGGSGANFVIQWSSPLEDAAPIMEAVMIATEGKPLSFTTRGVPIPSMSSMAD